MSSVDHARYLMRPLGTALALEVGRRYRRLDMNTMEGVPIEHFTVLVDD